MGWAPCAAALQVASTSKDNAVATQSENLSSIMASEGVSRERSEYPRVENQSTQAKKYFERCRVD
jgi:hypothetical protein